MAAPETHTRAVAVTEITSASEPVLQNLMQLYFHDFADFRNDRSAGDLRDDGRFGDYPMAPYWSTPGWSAALIHADGVLAGFVMVDDRSHSGLPTASNMAEFFVVRKLRGTGIAIAAARAVFASRPGGWEVAAVRRNLPALAFWRKAIRGAPQARQIEETDLDTPDWNGPILRFVWRG